MANRIGLLLVLSVAMAGQSLPRLGEYLQGDTVARLEKKYGKPVREGEEWRLPKTTEGWEIRVRGQGKVIEVRLPGVVKRQALRDAYGTPREATFLRAPCPGQPLIESHPEIAGESYWQFAKDQLYVMVNEKPMRLLFQTTPLTLKDNPCAKPLRLAQYLNRNSLAELEGIFGKPIDEGSLPDSNDQEHWQITFPLRADGADTRAYVRRKDRVVVEISVEPPPGGDGLAQMILNYGRPRKTLDCGQNPVWLYPDFQMWARGSGNLAFTTKWLPTAYCKPDRSY